MVKAENKEKSFPPYPRQVCSIKISFVNFEELNFRKSQIVICGTRSESLIRELLTVIAMVVFCKQFRGIRSLLIKMEDNVSKLAD